ncbi:MAG: hypothetical protein FWG08_06440 [Propionibacteriaceae bacterium]|nr:hypothetical protein [Propionibacteriaceae bacterium]
MTLLLLAIDWRALILVATVAITATVIIASLMSLANWFFVPKELTKQSHAKAHSMIDILIGVLAGFILGLLVYQIGVQVGGWPALNAWIPLCCAVLVVLVLMVLMGWPTSHTQSTPAEGTTHVYRMMGFLVLGLIGCFLSFGLWLMIPYFH